MTREVRRLAGGGEVWVRGMGHRDWGKLVCRGKKRYGEKGELLRAKSDEQGVVFE